MIGTVCKTAELEAGHTGEHARAQRSGSLPGDVEGFRPIARNPFLTLTEAGERVIP